MRPEKFFMWGVLLLENKTEEAPPHKELGLSNLYAGDPFISLCGYSLCAFSPPILGDLCEPRQAKPYEERAQ